MGKNTADQNFLYKRLVKSIEEQVKTGALKPGDAMPSEARLKATFGVSRVTVRRALLELEQHGVITKIHGKGSYISASTISHPLHNEVKTIVEAFKDSGVKLDVEVLSLEHIDPPAAIAELFDVHDEKVVCLVRRYMSAGTPVCAASLYLKLAMSGVAYILKDAVDAEETSYTVFEKRLGITIGKVRHIISAVAADSQAAEALRLQKGQICLTLDRITYSTQGAILEVMRFIYAPGKVTFEIDLPRNPTEPTELNVRLA